MPEVNNTAELRQWLRTCPAILDSARFGVDFAGNSATEYTIYSSPTTLQSYTDIWGNVYFRPVQELNFILASVRSLSSDVLQNLSNLGFFNEVIEWVYRQNTMKNFPKIAEGAVISIMPTLSPFLIDAAANLGRYQIQLNIKYRRRN